MLAGSCSAAVDQFCLDILPGEGRLATCLSDQLREQQKADYTGSKLTDACIKELDAFKKDTTTNINRDLPLGEPQRILFAPLCARCTLAG